MQTARTVTQAPPATDSYRNIDPGQSPAFLMPEAPAFPQPPPDARAAQPCQIPPPLRVAPVQPEEKTRRAGTVTMAMVLIVAGALMVVHVFVPKLDLMLIARFSPLALVLLGTEILVLNLLSDGKKLKYDFLSMFVCFLLVCGSGAMALAGEVYQREAGTRTAGQRLSSELHTRAVDALSSAGLSYYTDDWHVYLGGADAAEVKDITAESIPAWADVTLDFRFDKSFDTPAAFTKACGGYIASLATAAPHIDHLVMSNTDAAQTGAEGETYYELSLTGSQNLGLSVPELEKRVSTFVWTDGGGSMPLAEYEAMQAELEQAELEAAAAEEAAPAEAGEAPEPLPPAVPETPETPVTPEAPAPDGLRGSLASAA